MALTVGDKAPDFTLKSNAQEEVTLSQELTKGPVVLAFFPLAFSGVCTKQFTDMGRDVDAWSENGARVFGVSVDHAYSLDAFAKSVGAEGITFLSDFQPRGEVAKKYGVFLDGPGITTRAMFVIDQGGKITHAEAMDAPPDMPDVEAARAAACALLMRRVEALGRGSARRG